MDHSSWMMRIALIAILSAAAHARAGFTIVSDAARPDRSARSTSFEITFNQPPDFVHTDSFGNPHDAFQYFYGSDPARFDFSGADIVIIRGVEIRFDHEIPVRDSINPSGEDFPHADGWGPQRGAVNFDLQGSTIRFAVPWDLLGETDESFAYHLFALEDGTLTTDIGRTFIPLPAAVWCGAAAVACVACVGEYQIRRSRRDRRRAVIF
jgi:hypothetical protein